ncbi:MAG: hypothetical protein KDC24_01630 [Saprospiraceae bacterium]|nr:hypothetical protein [Saprospiraceae bacterium]
MNVRSILLSGLFFFSFLSLSTGQTQRGDEILFQGGIGLLPTYFMDGATTNVIPIQANLSYKFKGLVSVGAFAGYSSATSKPKTNADGSVHSVENQNLIVGLRTAVHSRKFDNWDIYGGFNVGYNMPNASIATLQYGEDGIPGVSAKNEYIYGGFIGFAGYLNQTFGLYGEIGYGISLFQAGVTVRL